MNYLLILMFLPLLVSAENPENDENLAHTEIHKKQPINETGEEQLDKDFKPEEEISEDYPIPLPSDI